MPIDTTCFGQYLQQLRTAKGFSQKIVASKLGIDISMLSKIEHGERQVQSHMLKGLAEIFEINFKELQIKFLHNRISDEIGDEPYLIESLKTFISNNSK